MTKRRYTADTINDDALDKLYENASKGWRRGDVWKAKAIEMEADRDRLAAKYADALRIASEWCIESNDIGGIDAGDLAWRLEQAEHHLPEGDE